MLSRNDEVAHGDNTTNVLYVSKQAYRLLCVEMCHLPFVCYQLIYF